MKELSAHIPTPLLKKINREEANFCSTDFLLKRNQFFFQVECSLLRCAHSPLYAYTTIVRLPFYMSERQLQRNGWLVVLGLPALRDRVYIGPSPREGERKEKI